MQISINNISFNGYTKNAPVNTVESETQKSSTLNLKLSNYEVGQAILNRNNISFRNLATPIEVTNKYNKKIEDKDHLDLPNIHVYEYSDTNLRAIIDKNENMQDSTTLEICLQLQENKINDLPPLLNEVYKNAINQKFENQNIKTNIRSAKQDLFTINVKTNDKNTSIFNKINNIISNSHFTEKELEAAKQNVIKNIENINSNDDYYLLKKDILKKKNDYIADIREISLSELNAFSKKVINTTKATYYITINKKHLNDFSEKELLKNINNGIGRMSTHNTKASYDFALNNNSAIFIKDSSVDGIEFNYPFEMNNFRDCLIGMFTEFLLTFLAEPFYNENSEILTKNPILKNNERASYAAHNLKFFMPKPEFTNLTPQRALNIQKETAKMVCDTDFTVTLDDIKQVFKEKFEDEINKEYKEDFNNSNLYKYDVDVFQLYEILDSIKTSDIKNHIKKYILKQEPIVRYNNEKE